MQLCNYLASRKSGRVSFAQSGEDLIIDFIFRALGIKKPSYMDVGAHDPYLFSNTYFFYLRGSKGVTIEPDPDLHQRLVKERPGETHLNLGVAATPAARRPFFVMSTPTLSTFSESEASNMAATGRHRIIRVQEVDVSSIQTIVADHFGGTSPDLLSIDVEGLDFEIVASINFQQIRPIVICVETVTFSETSDEIKLDNTKDRLQQSGYIAYADTYINTIFVDKKKWQSRP
jgi:FkbM family methyltransferase